MNSRKKILLWLQTLLVVWSCIFPALVQANDLAQVSATSSSIPSHDLPFTIQHFSSLDGDADLHDTPFLFTGFFGNQTDANGLIYMRARYYNPLLRRFLNVDPAREGWNWYGYAGGNPMAFVDPTGLGISSVLDAVQTTLGFLGMIPVVGNIFDAVNVGISLGRGHYGEAMLAAASAIPGAGLAAGGVGIFARTSRGALRTSSRSLFRSSKTTIPSAGGAIRQFEQPAARTYYRVFSDDATTGKWLTSVPPRSSAFAQEALALPSWNKASMIQEVRVPAGTMLERSRAIPVPEWGRLRGGAEQFQLLDEIPLNSFGPGVPLR